MCKNLDQMTVVGACCNNNKYSNNKKRRTTSVLFTLLVCFVRSPFPSHVCVNMEKRGGGGAELIPILVGGLWDS